MIKKLIAEATECDFKVALETKKPKSWLKSVSAFANGIGGSLFFGLDNDGKMAGLANVQTDAEAISRLIKERITPLPQFVLTPVREDDKDALILSVAAGRTTPYYYKADGIMEAYVRVGNESVAAPDYVVNELILKGTNRSFDALITDARKEDYSFTLLEATYRERTGLRLEAPDYISFGLMDKDGLLTNAGKLLTDQHIVYNSRVFCTRWNGLEKGSIFDDALDDKEFEGKPIQECDINAIGSVRRNPVIADLFHRMKFMERRGSGLKKILSETEKLPGYSEELKPEFFSTPSDFRVVLKNINCIISLLEFCSIARTRDEMQEYFGVSSREYFRKNILKPLLEAKQLVMTIPDKPKSKYQKYITSQK